MEVTFVKGTPSAPDRDRVYVMIDGEARRVAVHPVHDLPHLVIESFFGIEDGPWGELERRMHAESNRAASALTRIAKRMVGLSRELQAALRPTSG